MTCEVIKDKNGNTTVVFCHRGERRRMCKYCGNPAIALCDFELYGEKKGKTCDLPLCANHRFLVDAKADGTSIDFCPPHKIMFKKKESNDPS